MIDSIGRGQSNAAHRVNYLDRTEEFLMIMRSVVLATVVALLTTAANADVFVNSSPITWDSGAENNGSLYPSPILVTGLGNSTISVSVTIQRLTHTNPEDLGFVLVGPTGAAFLIQDFAGSSFDMSNVTYTLADAGATFLPNSAAITDGTYRPTSHSFSSDSFPAPGPGTSYSKPGPLGVKTFSSVFDGRNPNGTWNLFTRDFVSGEGGSMNGGWSLNITAVPEPSGFILGALVSSVAGLAFLIRRRLGAMN